MNQENSTHAIEILKDVSRRHSDATFLVDDELGIKTDVRRTGGGGMRSW